MIEANHEPSGRTPSRPRLRGSTAVFLIGDLEATARWYEQLGFTATLFPPGFAIVSRDDVEIFLQHADNYTRPDDPIAQERVAWDLYIKTDDARGLFEEYSRHATVVVTRPPVRQPYGQLEFEVLDPNGYVLVFAETVDPASSESESSPQT